MADQHKPESARILYLEDVQVGDRYESDRYALDSHQIKAFAAEFDPQPFHLDEKQAETSFFGGLAASGWHTAALTMRLMVTGSFKPAGGMIGAGVELSWPAPTRPDDILHVESEVIEINPSRSRPDRGIVTIRSETRNQHGVVVQKMVSRMLMFSRVNAPVQKA